MWTYGYNYKVLIIQQAVHLLSHKLKIYAGTS